MIEVKDMKMKDMLGIINVPSIECMMMTDDAKKEILSRFAEKDKVIELMAPEIQEYAGFANVRIVIKHYTEKAKRQLQTEKENA